MELRVLHYFLTVAEEENITRAASVLHTSQPNLSRQLSDLEKELGQQLFTRGHRKITLTEEGMFLRKRAKEIIELTDRTVMDLQLYEDAISGDVHIGAAESYTMRMISTVMLQQRKKAKNIRHHVFSGSTIEVSEQLNKGLLDFAIFVEPIDLSKYEYLKLPINDRWGIIMHKHSPLAKLESIQPQDIIDKEVIVSQQQLDSGVLSGWLGQDIRNLNIVGTFNLVTTPAMMVAAGLGYVFTFDKLVNITDDSDICFRPLTPAFETSLYFVWKKNKSFSPAAKMFLDEMKHILL